MKRWVLYIIIGAVVAAAVGLGAWRLKVARQPEQEMRSAVVGRGTLLVTVSASGNVEPLAEVNLVFDIGGRIAEVPVQVGDHVAMGDVLARLDTEQLELQVKQAEAALASAEAKLTQLTAGPRPEEVRAAEANLRAAEARVSAAIADRDQLQSSVGQAEIAAAEADYASATAQQRKAEDLHDKTLTCKKFTLPTGKVKIFCPALGMVEEQARYSLEAADRALAAARASLDELLAGPDADALRAAQENVLAAMAQRDAAQAQLDLLLAGPTEGQVAAAQAHVAQARAALEQAELMLDNATLRAPFDGVVAAVHAVAGEMASVGRSGITLVDPSAFKVALAIDELDVGRLTEGQAAQVTFDALPDQEIAGTVERIAPAARLEGGVVTYDVVVRLAPTDVPIRTDMTANVTIVVEELSDVLRIPTWAVRVDRLTGQTYVYRQTGDKIERVDVTLGVRHEGMAQVISGLSEGDTVLWVPADTGPFEF